MCPVSRIAKSSLKFMVQHQGKCSSSSDSNMLSCYQESYLRIELWHLETDCHLARGFGKKLEEDRSDQMNVYLYDINFMIHRRQGTTLSLGAETKLHMGPVMDTDLVSDPFHTWHLSSEGWGTKPPEVWPTYFRASGSLLQVFYSLQQTMFLYPWQQSVLGTPRRSWPSTCLFD